MLFKLLLIAFSIISLNNCQAQEEVLRDCLNSPEVEIVTQQQQAEQYEQLRQTFNVRKSIFPKGFLVPSNTDDVQRIIKCANDLKLLITPKCGGHAFEYYSLGSENHWVVSVHKINHVRINRMDGTARVGAGINNWNLVQKLLNYGYVLSVGVCKGVGVAGYSLGGGIGFLARSHGLMLDRILEIVVVTADGEIRTANQNRNSELFWALRGAGGGNFGIVVEFKFRLIKSPSSVITVVKAYNMSEFDNVWTKWVKWSESDPDKSITPSLYYNFPVPGLVFLKAVIAGYSKLLNARQLQNMKQFFPELTDSDVMVSSVADCLSELSYDVPPAYFKASTYNVNTYQDGNAMTTAARNLNEYSFILIDMVGGQIRETKDNTSYIHRDAQAVVMICVGVAVTDDYTVEEVCQQGESNKGYITSFLSETRGMDSGHSYQNYIDHERCNWQYRYYGENYARLQDIKTKYDPNYLLRNEQNIAPRGLP